MSPSVLLLIGLVLYIIYKFLYKPHRFWSERGVPHNKPWPIFGDLGKLIIRRETISENIQRLYNDFPDSRYHGVYQFLSPILLIKDLDLIKKVLVKDFDHFHDHKAVLTENIEPLFSKSLIALQGEKWSSMRATLSPAFTSAKMRSMFLLISEVAEQFTMHFLKENKEKTITLSMKDVFTRFANDVIASTAFGLKCDSLAEKNNEFFAMGKEITEFSAIRLVKFAIFAMSPKLFEFLGLNIFPKTLNSFFRRIVKETITVREERGIIRPDMLHLLMEARKGSLKQDNSKQNIQDTGFATVEETTLGTAKKELTDDDITAQALLFFFAGFITSSTLMCYMSYELAANPDVQKKLQDEIDQTLVSNKEKITYDALLKMKYLDMVVCESLRKWPPVVQADRISVKDYTIEPINHNEKPFKVEAGTTIFAPIFGIHRDPKYYPNPELFDPERFSDENKEKIVTGSYIPFGFGPRNCIGSRFALLETKAMIFHLLSKFEIVIVEKTKVPPQLTVQLDDFWLGLRPRG